jgi:hypothetical protein
VTEQELAWAAGFFDGEGTVYLWNCRNNSGHYRTLALSINQVDRRPLERFQTAVEVGTVSTHPISRNKLNAHPKWRDQHRWYVFGHHAMWALEILSPYLSGPKLEQARLVLDKLNGRTGYTKVRCAT